MTNKTYIIKQLRDKEWSMGNGQCPCCGGTEDGFNKGLHSYNEFDMGHRETCETAMILENYGEEVLWKRKSKLVSKTCVACNEDLLHPEPKIKSDYDSIADFTRDVIRSQMTCPNCKNNLLMQVKYVYKEEKQ